MNTRLEQRRPKLPWTKMEDAAMKSRIVLPRYRFLVGALALALILLGVMAIASQATGRAGIPQPSAWIGQAKEALPAVTQAGVTAPAAAIPDSNLPAAAQGIAVPCGDITKLKAAFGSANSFAGDTTITLNSPTQSNCVYTLTAVDNTTNGPNGLPVINRANLQSLHQRQQLDDRTQRGFRHG